VGGTVNFRATTPGTSQYIVIWFTKLPPATGGFAAQILSIIVRGAATSS
jgi:hypothetical protein